MSYLVTYGGATGRNGATYRTAADALLVGHALEARGETRIRITDMDTQADYDLRQLDALVNGAVAGNA